MTTPTFDEHLHSLWQGFFSTYSSLSIFASKIGERADQFDEERIQQMASDLAFALGECREVVLAGLRNYLTSWKDKDTLPDVRNNDEFHDVIKHINDPSFKQLLSDWEQKEPQKSDVLMEILRELFIRPPISAVYLRQSCLIALVSAVEDFINNLLYAYGVYKDKDNWKQRWNKLDKVITECFASDPWTSLPDNEATDLREKYKRWQEGYTEIIQRRNILVHNGGRVDEHYLDQAPKAHQPPGITAGQIVLVSPSYLQKAFDLSLTLLFTLTQLVWRKGLAIGQTNQNADKMASDLIYELLRQKQYALVIELAELAIKFHLDQSERMLVLVNKGVALRKYGRKQELKSIISQLRRSDAWLFQMAAYILNGENDAARRIMINNSPNLRRQAKLSWPLFDFIREKPWFSSLFGSVNKAVLSPE
ncbi:MAG TPA: hypothetical protein DEF43_04090 [Chloroflexus aurantiacus]|uniref:Uncharacterized protein n=1 Tax=Chloroflexus aurantiacus (strain ATCC 29366 / DSM 635 / J-10-fl) TaxID=324602 RepID=A9WAL2_CHLAA|nr:MULTISPECIES: hypothetical protein [Chloroflexus]ABY36802.1 hypothetical protein Caur_3618 [Chloroflexus aurantiacus J-10-fl]RMG52463.1 MAG: hypothetical protein D6716_03505 [Chloroflexota bacterium]HBW66339.1 hypothetical protein [Chloroflexus aurantiacus]